MSGFRKRKVSKVRLGVPCHIWSNVANTVEESVDGNTVQRVVILPVDMSSKEAEASLPDAKEYTLQKLLDAGVPLQQLSVAGLLDPSDMALNALHADSKLSSIVESLQKSETTEATSEKSVE